MLELQDLIIKSLFEDLNSDEQFQLNSWLDESLVHRQQYEGLRNGNLLVERLKLDESIRVEKALKNTLKNIKGKRRKVSVPHWISYAAVWVVGLAVTFLLLRNPQYEISSRQLAENEISVEAGNRKAELTLADGKKMCITDQMDKNLTINGTQVEVNGHFIQYEKKVRTSLAYNKISIPRGGTYILILADGTKVHFNALTELEYPVQFVENERRVKLKGEAFFEVAPDVQKPFIVELEEYEIKVLGTTFNVEAYAEDRKVKTTLCTGKISVSSTISDALKEVNVRPGQQLIWDRENRKARLQEVDTDLYTAWVHNKFYFSNNTLEEIFTVLQRWYDIQVVFANDKNRFQCFSGKFPRLEDMETTLLVLENVGIKYIREGNTIVIL